MNKRWLLPLENKEPVSRLVEALQVSPVVAQLMVNRGLSDVEEARTFLSASLADQFDPFLLKGMEEGVAEIERLIEVGGSIVIYGDYDVDGITATSLLYRFLQSLGAKVDYYIPERQSEGYGLNIEALEHLIERGTDLVITVDCGISSYEIIEQVRDRLSVVITDHHEAPDRIPRARAVINHKQPGCPYPDKNLAGCGVTYKLCQALWLRRTGQWYTRDLDIVALGTVADVVPLLWENRIYVKAGLIKMLEEPNVGIQALIEVAGLKDKVITAGHIGFTLAPRLNAAGRVAHAKRAVELLTAQSFEEALVIAQELNDINIERQELERSIHEAARQDVLQQGHDADYVTLVAGEDWHPGVIGIVASRLVEEFYKPTLVVSLKDGIGKGSCRSIDNCNIYEALQSAEDLLIQFGGHQAAAGFSIKEENLPLLRQRLVEYCNIHLKEDDYIPRVKLDAELDIEAIDVSLVDEISALEPYGMGNSTPVFSIQEAVVGDVFLMGAQKRHAKVVFETSQGTLEAIKWQAPELHREYFPGDRVKVAFTMQKNEWQGHVTPQLMIQDIQLVEGQAISLTREGLRTMYIWVKQMMSRGPLPRYKVESDLIRHRPEGFTMAAAMKALDVFQELNLLVEESTEDGVVTYRWQAAEGHLDLVTSVTFLTYSGDPV